jgi:hypothetical protein
MSADNPCCHDCTDFPEEQDTQTGCCAPIPVRLTCEAPVLPVPACDEEDPEIIYDEDTEEFFAVGILYDSECSPLSDSAASTLTALVA